MRLRILVRALDDRATRTLKYKNRHRFDTRLYRKT